MIAEIKTEFNCSPETLWKKLETPSSLEYVSSPVLSFIPVEEDSFDEKWEPGKCYKVRLYLLKRIPLGIHNITVVEVDRENNIIISNENGSLATIWNHAIKFESVGTEKITYTDKIEIRAGTLTIPIWLFAHIFYRHRQKRWKKLLSMDDSTIK